MLLFVFFVATLNLAVGYALGAGWTLASLLDLLPRRRAKKTVDAGDDGPTLTKPAAATPPKPAAVPEAPPVNGGAADIVAGLSAFRDQLSAASDALNESEQDPDAFEQNASKLQEANHAYLEEADNAIRDLDKMGAEGDATATATAQAVSDGKDEVAQLSGEIDGIIEGGIDDAARAELVAKSKAAAEAAGKVELVRAPEKSAEATGLAESPNAANDPSSSPDAEATPSGGALDEVFDLLESRQGESQDEVTRYVVAVRVDPISGHEADETALRVAEHKIAEMTAGLLEETQTLVKGSPSAILFDGDTLEEAIERTEKIRAAVEATEFDVDGETCQATVTCALVDAEAGDTRDNMIANINQALEEGLCDGGNQTYHHDGAFPTAVQATEAVEA